ncbi:MAG: DoxX family protein [Candidatus Kapabacteria bacterium]|nr:DoxX family protein [Candidatus Kapabacteria bacterium]MDW8225179.1 DoxX family protein [Bacteroidota bacterium]
MMPPWLAKPVGPNLALTVLRVWMGAMMLWHGVPKFGRMEGFQQRVAEMGFPMPEFFAWAAALSETLGGVSLILGLGFRIVLPLVAVTMAVAVFIAHAGDPFSRRELAATYGVVILVLWLLGPGRWSVDMWLAHRSQQR